MNSNQPKHTEAPKPVNGLNLLPASSADPTKCADCGTNIGEPDSRPWPFPRWCSCCEAKREAECNAALKIKCPWQSKWDNEICPPNCADTDLNDPSFNQPAWSEASKWKFGFKGLTLFGDSRRCKTRIMFEILKREFLTNHRSVKVIYGPQLRDDGKRASREGCEHRMSEALVYPDILALDDPFLAGASDERVTAYLLAVIDARLRNKKPIILTTQVGGEDLKHSAARFGKITESDIQRLDAAFKRLREVGTTVVC